jgi:hypothetical protein
MPSKSYVDQQVAAAVAQAVTQFEFVLTGDRIKALALAPTTNQSAVSLCSIPVGTVVQSVTLAVVTGIGAWPSNADNGPALSIGRSTDGLSSWSETIAWTYDNNQVKTTFTPVFTDLSDAYSTTTIYLELYTGGHIINDIPDNFQCRVLLLLCKPNIITL